MKQYIVLLLLPLTLFGTDTTVMVAIKGEQHLPKIARLSLKAGIDEALTKAGYALIEEDIQKMALKEQAKQQNSPCYDAGCLVKTGRMLAAKELLMVDVKPVTTRRFITLKLIDIENGVIKSQRSRIYSMGELKQPDQTLKIGQKMIDQLLKITHSKKRISNQIITVPPASPLYTIHFNTEPQGGIIYIDGEEIGRAPFKIELSRGEHLISSWSSKRDEVKKSLFINKNQEFTLSLGNEFYHLELSVDPTYATIFHHNKILSNGDFIKVYRNKPGISLEITAGGFRKKTVIINPDDHYKTKKLSINLKPNHLSLKKR